jgi:hypothetical protein
VYGLPARSGRHVVLRGGIESAFVDVDDDTIGLTRIGPSVRSEGPKFSARLRAEKAREATEAG